MKIMFSKRFPYFLYRSKYVGDKHGVRGSRRSHNPGSSKHVSKHIAIDQESLISRSWNNLNPPNPYKYKNQKTEIT